MSAAVGDAQLTILIMRVEGMTCAVCSGTVERTLKNTKGVSKASVSCATHMARIEFDAEVISIGDLCESVEDVGFGANVVEEVSPRKRSQIQPITVELRVLGMTSAVCSGKIEQHLQTLPGVERVTVSLVLGRAFVVCDPARLNADKIVDEIEELGYNGEVEKETDYSATNGRANLHVRIPGSDASSESAAVEDFIRKINGVLGLHQAKRETSPGLWCVTYDPNIVGARGLLKQIKQDFPAEWENAGMENEALQVHLREMRAVRRDLCRAIPLASVIMTCTMLLPMFGFQRKDFGFLAMSLHHGVDYFTICVLLMATPVQFFMGNRFHTAALAAMKRKTPNMDVLVSIATNISYFYSAGLILFCLLAPNVAGSHELVAATIHFMTTGTVLITIVLLGKFLEARAKQMAMEVLTDLPSSRPAYAKLCSDQGGETDVPVELVELGDALRVFPGGKIPVDGTICSDNIVHADESLLTGESIPVAKRPGELILGGTTCVSGGCLMRVTKVGCDTTLGQMEQLVQEAQASKAAIQRFADRIARVFVPTVIGLAFATFGIWCLLVFGGYVTPTMGTLHQHTGGDDMQMDNNHMFDESEEFADPIKLLFAVKFGMAVLMIACPCAMGLATPMAVMVATGVAAKRGCLVKSAAALETASRLHAIVLDKTGTITQGTPAVSGAVLVVDAMQPLFAKLQSLMAAMRHGRRPSRGQLQPNLPMGPTPIELIGKAESDFSAAELKKCFWWLLGTLESASDHPIAKCILGTVQAMQGLPPIIAPKEFEYFSGRGVCCSLEALDGAQARVGNVRFYEEHSGGIPETQGSKVLQDWVSAAQVKGQTVVVLHIDGNALGAVALHDPVREDAAWVVSYLTKTLGLEVWMCTGDNTATAEAVAKEVGITGVVSEALPAVKSDCVKQLQSRSPGSEKRRIGFCGDGINDAPALAQADVGIAIGVGAQVAVEAAEVALVRAELGDLASYLALSRKTMRTIFLNFFWAFCFNFVCLPIAAGLFYPKVYIPPVVAGMGMAASSCLVVFSSLCIQRFKPPEKPSESTQSPRGKWRNGGDESERQSLVVTPGRIGSSTKDVEDLI